MQNTSKTSAFITSAICAGLALFMSGCGGGGSNNAPSPEPTPPAPRSAIVLLAGSPVESGYIDGVGAAARMSFPGPVAVDSAGNTYVADNGNRVVRKVTPEGVVSTLAGSAGTYGRADGTGKAASFSDIRAITVDGAGNLYVADTDNCFLCTTHTTWNTIRKITPGGVVSTLVGADGRGANEFADGSGAAARIYLPSGLATDSAGNVYVADCGNEALRKMSPAGVVTTLVRSGVCLANPLTSLTSATPPRGLALDSAGNFYVTDRELIRKISASGTMSILAGSNSPGAADGSGATARFDSPRGLAIDGAGNVYVADAKNNAIRMVTPAGLVTTLAGKFGSTGVVLGPLPGSLTAPQSVAIDSRGALAVSTGNAIVKIQ